MASESTEKVNAGADIEKELAALSRAEDVLNICTAVTVHPESFDLEGLRSEVIEARNAVNSAWAALLAEAGERVKLTDKWVDAIQSAIGNMGRIGDRDYFTFCLFLVFEQAQKDGLIPADPRTQQRIDELRPKIALLKDKLTTVDKVAERARGLEAQLETVTSLLRQTEERCTRCKMFAGQVVTPCGLHLLVRAALSQLPTPKKQPEKP